MKGWKWWCLLEDNMRETCGDGNFLYVNILVVLLYQDSAQCYHGGKQYITFESTVISKLKFTLKTKK